MDYFDALAEASRAAGMTSADVARSAGRAASFISASHSRGSQPRTDTAAALLDACGWALVAIPADSIPAGAIRIDPAPAPRR